MAGEIDGEFCRRLMEINGPFWRKMSERERGEEEEERITVVVGVERGVR